LLVVRHALVLADGSVGDRIELDRAWPGWDDDLDLVVAADGGARHAARVGLRLDRWVGDGD
jgi:thiamine pyrophosphokinase